MTNLIKNIEYTALQMTIKNKEHNPLEFTQIFNTLFAKLIIAECGKVADASDEYSCGISTGDLTTHFNLNFQEINNLQNKISLSDSENITEKIFEISLNHTIENKQQFPEFNVVFAKLIIAECGKVADASDEYSCGISTGDLTTHFNLNFQEIHNLQKSDFSTHLSNSSKIKMIGLY